MTYFTYNGRSSADFGLHIEKKDVFSAPEYDAEFISIPGRSGDIINPNRRFANIKVTYTVFLARKNVAALASDLRDIKGWLYSEPDRYHELTDSYDAEYFRYGVISGSLDIAHISRKSSVCNGRPSAGTANCCTGIRNAIGKAM